jgi:hypothetical protein
MLTPKSNINITLGNTYSSQSFNSYLFQILDNGSTDNLRYNSKNDVNYNFNDAFLGIHYKILRGKFTFTPGVSLHTYNMNNKQLGTEFKQSFYRILPDFLAIYQIKKAETLTYNFAFTNSFTDINNLGEGFVLNNYSSLSRGYSALENATVQTHSLRYFKYNMFNFENIHANLSYSRTTDAIKSEAKFIGVNQTTTPFNSEFPEQTISGFGGYGRSFLKRYKASVNTRLSWAKFNNIIVNPANVKSIDTNESFTQNYAFKVSTNYKNLPNIEIGYEININNYSGTAFYNEKPSVRLDYFFLKSFSFVSEYEFNHYYNKSKTSDNEYDFLSASLIYQKTKNSKWEYKIAATNLLNTTSLNDDSYNQFSTRTSQYTVQPRYVIFSLKYNL